MSYLVHNKMPTGPWGVSWDCWLSKLVLSFWTESWNWKWAIVSRIRQRKNPQIFKKCQNCSLHSKSRYDSFWIFSVPKSAGQKSAYIFFFLRRKFKLGQIAKIAKNGKNTANRIRTVKVRSFGSFTYLIRTNLEENRIYIGLANFSTTFR